MSDVSKDKLVRYWAVETTMSDAPLNEPPFTLAFRTRIAAIEAAQDWLRDVGIALCGRAQNDTHRIREGSKRMKLGGECLELQWDQENRYAEYKTKEKAIEVDGEKYVRTEESVTYGPWKSCMAIRFPTAYVNEKVLRWADA